MFVIVLVYFMIINLLLFAAIAIIIGVVFLVMISRELTSPDKTRWFIGLGLGSGVLAFTLKILLIVSYDSIPETINLENKNNISILKKIETKLIKPDEVRQLGYQWRALPEIAPSPKNNPTTFAKIKLGKKLFFDKRLSANNSISCSSCHDLSKKYAGADGRQVAFGINQKKGTRNSPSVINAAFQRKLFWDGRASTLEEQAKGPLINPLEMAMPSLQAVEDKLRKILEYSTLFNQAFPESPAITIENIVKAIASFERTLITPNSPYDKFVKGDISALTNSQIRGMALFEKNGCVICHSGPNFSGASVFDSNGAFRLFPSVKNQPVEDRYKLNIDGGVITNNLNVNRKGIWRIPSLRNVSRTSPYFHNGSVKTLTEAVRVMAKLQLNKKISNDEKDDIKIFWNTELKQFIVTNNHALSEWEIQDIVAFLHSLEGDINQDI